MTASFDDVSPYLDAAKANGLGEDGQQERRRNQFPNTASITGWSSA